MDRIKKGDSPLMKQFKSWARHLLKVNPDYVKNPQDLIWYIKGPNWNDPDVDYAHYRMTISLYGKELLDKFERLRSLPEKKAIDEYKALLMIAGIKEGEER